MEIILNRSNKQIAWLLAGLSALFFIPFLGHAHLFDWDEINFAEASREMLLTGNLTSVTIDFEPFWEKPPLFFWMQMFSMKIFGVSEFAARLPNAICGIVTIVLLFNMGTKLRNSRFGLMWALLYLGSLLPHFYFKSGIIDPWFNLFIFLGIWHFTRGTEGLKSMQHFALAGVFTGLAVMTKGPVALLIVLMVVGLWWMLQKFKKSFTWKDVLAFAGAFVFTGSLWFVSEILAGRGHIIQEFIEYQIRLFNTQDAGHGGPFFYHWIVLLLGCFPASFFMVPAIRRHVFKYQSQNRFVQMQTLIFWCVLILFSIVKTKIVHYSSLCYFPLTFLAADAIFSKQSLSNPFTRIGLIVVSITLGIALIIMPFFENLKPWILRNIEIKDPFAVANMDATANWIGFEWIAGVLLIVSTIWFLLNQRKGLQNALSVYTLLTALAINLAVTLYPSQVEAYSQRAAIEFYKDHQGEECLIYPIGFKSYAHLFYSKKPEGLPAFNQNPMDIFTENPPYPVYFVAKIQKAEEIQNSMPRLRELYRKNGFVFYELGAL